MAKKPASAPTEPDVMPGEFDIPAVVGGKGRTGDRSDYVSVVGSGGTHLATYPNDQSLAHMSDWRYATAAFKANRTGEIVEVKLIKSERGCSLRRRENQRPHFHISLGNVVVTVVDHDSDVGTCVSCIESDGSVVFTLPKVIKGKSGWYKISRRS
jgi:hypothetical protein